MPAVDVAVVGAGPAGAAAATHLARAGRRVLLVDKARFPRDKCCGDGLTTSALRHLEALGLRSSELPSWRVVEDVVARGPAGRSVRLPLPRGRGVYAAVARRAELDAALVDLARQAGAQVADGCALVGTRPVSDGVELEVEGLGPITARYAIGADGAWSPLRKRLGADRAGTLGELHAFRQYFRNVGPRAATELHVWFEPDLLPGYAWSFPLAGGRANVGFGIARGGKVATRTMKALWPDILERPHVRAVVGPEAEAEAPHKAWPIPARIRSVALTAAGGRALFVGDAAAAGDPLTGEGIGQALLTAELAARAVLVGGPGDPSRVETQYRGDVERALFADASLSHQLAKVVRHRKGVRASLWVAGSTPWSRRQFARWLFEDYPRAYLGTPRRWRAHSLVGDGAWST